MTSAPENLTNAVCEPCRGGMPPLEQAEITRYLAQVPQWEAVRVNGVDQITRTFTFPDYRRCLEFTVAVGELAEREDHHPAITLEWGKVAVTWWTHKINGLHANDFICAAKTDVLAT